MTVKEVSETGETQESRTPTSPPPLLAPLQVVVSIDDATGQGTSGLSLGVLAIPLSYLQVEPKQVLGCVVWNHTDNLSATANFFADGACQVQIKNGGMVSGNWTPIYTFTSGQVYVSGSTGPGDVLIGTTAISGMNASGYPLPMKTLLRGPLEFRLVSGFTDTSGMNLRDVRVGVIPVY